ncbi:MAG: glycosyltransferase [Phycisphaerales bacterium]|nr:MAG: glycosyltransferase [Phycisphaerales bacterium]
MTGEAQPINLVHFVGEGIFSPVLDSQVLTPLRLLGEHAPHIDRTIVCLTSVRYQGDSAVKVREDEIRKKIPGVTARFAYRPFLDVPLQGRIWARHLGRALAERGFSGDSPIIIHCRGHCTGAAAAIAKQRDRRLRILLDMRGDPLDEVQRPGLVGRYLAWLHRGFLVRAFSAADGVNTVTKRLADVLRERGMQLDRGPDLTIGCCVDTRRFYFDSTARSKHREELELKEKFVLCYCGAMSHWQRPDAVAGAFAAVLQHMPDAHLLIVSREADRLVDHLSRAGVGAEHVTVRAAAHDQVADFLQAADVGLLLREDCPTNQVASPVKFAEYLRCGLPVILTPYIGDFGELVTRENVGRTVTFPVRTEEMIDAAKSLRKLLESEGDDFRRRCSRVAQEQLSWEGKLTQLVELYEKLSV